MPCAYQICQFPDEPAEFECDGKQWCRFHFPMEDEEGNTTAKRVWPEEVREAFEVSVKQEILSATQENKANLHGIVFPRGTQFGSLDCTFHVNFKQAQFWDETDFAKVKFGDGVCFEEAQFGPKTTFRFAKFGLNADFRRADFGPGIDFSDSTFGHGAILDGSVFNGHSSFINAHFNQFVSFVDVEFKGFAVFPYMHSLDDLGEPAVFRAANFQRAHFHNDISFNNRTFLDEIDFSNAVFRGIPEFHNATLHQDVSFQGTKFLFFKGDDDITTERAERAYRTLKLAMEENRSRTEEADFFALEMECRRNRTDIPWYDRLMTTFYKYGSNYGRSYLWPLGWIVGLILFLSIPYTEISRQTAGGCEARGASVQTAHCIRRILIFEGQMIIRPFALWDDRYKPKDEMIKAMFKAAPTTLRLMTGLQSLTTIGLLTLFVLAVRRRFRMV